ncbi:hypothetical protein ID866_8140, partial [Astraeus odoratus]
MTSQTGGLKHSYFYVDTITFQVEDCLFKVPRGPFEQDSAIFCDMFTMPKGNIVRDVWNEKPIQLDGVSKDDFEQFLKVLFHRKHGSLPYLPVEIHEWTSVLKLSTAWDFQATRQAAIDALHASQIEPVDRVVLAQQYDIKDWLLPALNQLAQRVEPISLEEAGQIGVDFALKVTWNYTLFVSDSRDNAAQGFDYSEAIRTIFALICLEGHRKSSRDSRPAKPSARPRSDSHYDGAVLFQIEEQKQFEPPDDSVQVKRNVPEPMTKHDMPQATMPSKIMEKNANRGWSKEVQRYEAGSGILEKR